MFCDGPETKWICPSDRKLILRARLQLGWSFHSHNVFRRYEPLQDSDMRIILPVLSRACEIQEIERERVGNLVQRLENMKGNAWGNGLNSCAMCAQSLGFFKTSSYTCLDCQKFVCSKCCVDTWSTVHEPLMLCKICAENRELWKKSGGWFYGYLPTPEKNMNSVPNSINSSQATWSHRIPEIVCFDSFEPPQNESIIEERSIGRTWASNSSLQDNDSIKSDIEDTTDTPDGDNNNENRCSPISNVEIRQKGGSRRQQALKNRMNNLESMLALSTSCPSLLPRNTPTEAINSQADKGILEFSLMYNSRSKVLQCTIYCVKELMVCNSTEVQYYLNVEFIPVNQKMIILRTKSALERTKIEFNETLVFSQIRRKMLKDQFLWLLLIKEDPFNDTLVGKVRVNLNTLKPMESKFFLLPLTENKDQQNDNKGQILITFMYTAESLSLEIISCSNLQQNTKTGLVDSFVRIEMFSEDSIIETYDTEVKCDSLNPEFNEVHFFYLSPPELKYKSLKISVIEVMEGKINSCIGTVNFGIQAKGETLRHWLQALKSPGQKIEKWHTLTKNI